MLPVVRSRNGKFFIAVIQVLLREIKPVQLQHLVANSRRGTVAANHQSSFSPRFLAGFLIPQAKRASFNLVSGAALAEVNDGALLFSGVDKRNIQLRSGNRIYDLPFIFSIGLKGKLAGSGMHHASLHRDSDTSHLLPQAGLLQSVNASGR